ncbi:restriction endonuclease subunit S [Pseudoalteromonas sp. Isolate3]|uniref:restriction endonuclease subunit S n=1 Tax=Pseudoalteromonas sp. Isolate3 TaxID=2908526 RepID=UPI001EFC950D|nr:restriction endonuclease subunit S [Pseudoalteromonas sp. Isolate3]MCG9710885.1 restriction endonuclease subunit S [Pseudoalteromonas sp. Isolate3]
MEWLKTTLGEVCDVRDGTHDSPKYQESGYPLVTSKNLKNGRINLDKIKYISESDFTKINERSAVHLGDVLFAMIGTIGNPVVIKYLPNFAIKNVALFKPKEMCDSQFLKYYLESPYVIEKMGSEAKGTTQKFVGLGYLRNFPVDIPPISEQKRIVAILDQAFADIEQARAKTEQNLKNARELFESYLQQVFSQRGEDVQSVELREVVDILTDYHANGSYKVLKQHVELKEQEDFAWMVRSTDFEKKFKNNKRYITEHAYNYLTKSKLFGGEIIMSKIGNAGKVYFMPETDRPCSLAMNLFLIRLDPSKANNEYIYRYLNSSSGKAQIAPRLKGAATQTITKDNVRSLQIPMPSLDGQQKAVETLKKLEKEIENLEGLYMRKLDNIDTLKKSILQKAFSGELTKEKEGAVA